MTGCCVNGCHNRYFTGGLKFYRIPTGSRPFQSNRRRLWLQAIQRVDWTEDIIKNARICGAHFISGEASLDYNSPDFVPSVFLCTKLSQNPNAKMDRRRDDRSNTAAMQHAPSETPEQESSMDNCSVFMGGRNCCVVSCRRKSHDHHGRKIPNGLTFHCFPAWRTSEGEQISLLTKTRRAAWVAAIGRSDITFDHIPTSMRICSRHFHSGKPAYEMLESDPDWVPSLNLIPSTGITRRTERLLPPVQLSRDKKQKITAKKRPYRRTQPAPAATTTITAAAAITSTTTTITAAAGGGGGGGGGEEESCSQRPAVRPWREVKSLLQSALQRKTIFNKPPAENTELAFRDFFRGALEASLEEYSRSRALSAQQRSDSGEGSMEMSFKLPALVEEKQACTMSCSSCCLNYLTLQRRITELGEKWTRLTGQQEDNNTAEEDPAWMEPLSPSQVAPNTKWIRKKKSSKAKKPQRARCFRTDWLKLFWFLRYSPTEDLMWCHVCRLYSEKANHNNSLVFGSRIFKFQNIKKHSSSNLHKENLSRYMLQVCDLQL